MLVRKALRRFRSRIFGRSAAAVFRHVVLFTLNGATGVAAAERQGAPAGPSSSWRLTASVPATREMTFDEFISEVLATNLDYAAQRYNVGIARAEAASARLWPNPTLQLGSTRDLTFHHTFEPDQSGNPVSQRLPETQSIGLTQTLDLAGKRRWRVRTADQTYRAAAATLEDFLRNLKSDASAAFAEALASRATVEQRRKAAGYLAELVRAQRVRFEKGEIAEADYLQSRLEQLQLENDLHQSEAAAAAAQFALCTFLARDRGQTTIVPLGEFAAPTRDYDLPNLIAQALTTRPDLIALRHTRDAADGGVRVARSERFPDVDLDVGIAHSHASSNFVAASPRFNQLDVGISLPLPLWNRNQHGIQKAQAVASQAQRQLDAAELKAEVEIRSAYTNYRAAVTRVQQFQDELLRGADTVLTARRFSYEHGQTSLLELLNAQRTANDVQQGFHDALADAVKARIALLRAAGLSETPL